MSVHEQTRPLAASLVQPGAPWLPVEVFAEVESTNSVLKAGPQPWRVVVAERQTRGRGRLGRTWLTAPGLGLAVSALVPATGMPLGWLPLTAGLALAEAIEASAGIATAVKWPNDVLLPSMAERKVAGILCEWTPVGVIVGAGINVHHGQADLPVPEATSVALAGGEVTREGLLTAYLRALADHVRAWTLEPQAAAAAYAARCVTLGRSVVLHEPAGQRSGVATGVDDEGRLELRTEAGVIAVSAGDVVHVRPPTST